MERVLDFLMRGLLTRHRLFVALLGVYLLAGLGTARFTDEYLLINGDYNIVNIVQVARAHDLPAADDMEAGHLRDALAYSSAYFSIPLLLSRIGVPARTFAIVHHVAVPAMLAAAVYYASFVLFGNAPLAVLAALLLSFADYAWFRTNVGYPLPLNDQIYYGDVNHVFAALMVAFILDRRYAASGIASLALSLSNITYGLNGAMCCVGFLALSNRRQPRNGRAVLGAAIAAAGVVAGAAQVAVMLAIAGRGAPADPAVRAAAIRAYGHLAIHTSDLIFYAAGIGALLVAAAYAVLVETRFSRRAPANHRAHFLAFARWMLVLMLLQGVAIYWILYTASPYGFIAVSPSKILMLGALYTCPYVAYAVWSLATRSYVRAFAIVAAGAFVYVVRGRTLTELLMLAVLIMTLSAIVVWLRPIAPDDRRGHSSAAMLLIGVLVIELGVALARPFRDGRISLTRELKTISLQMHERLDPEAILVPYRLPGTAGNSLGPFSNLALRTFSRRGYLPFWSLGRNAYFNSMKRQLAEERAFGAAGLSLWPDITARLSKAWDEDPVAYLTGIQIVRSPCCHVSRVTPAPSRLLLEKSSELEANVSHASPEEFATYARSLGGTHLFVSRDAGAALPWGPAVSETSHFAVIPLGR